MKLTDVFQKEELAEFYSTVAQWNHDQEIKFDLEDDWNFTPAPELEGDGIDSAYIAEWAGELGLLIGSSSGWDYYPTGYGMWTPVEFFSEAGQALLKQIGFAE